MLEIMVETVRNNSWVTKMSEFSKFQKSLYMLACIKWYIPCIVKVISAKVTDRTEASITSSFVHNIIHYSNPTADAPPNHYYKNTL
ncbi:hypothetical protein GDO78_016986 [Eleutherodactylus coqui]|uniref:Uncharacterized protein n=1 Tax=Eleutherodactylus coqui TaxID=57060 RepID=A0A8J6B039_ELECQ|nr:hypothetical protein GDO78_016986 [Eleutherodactylus coqui]